MVEQKLARFGWRAVDPPQRPVLFVNPRSGNGTAARLGLPERARDLGIEVVLFTGRDSGEWLVRAAVERGADALGMAGGDGSLAVVAAAAAKDLPFICIPAGTRNHFALDLGVDRHDVLGALDAFNGAVERRIDWPKSMVTHFSTTCHSGSTARQFAEPSTARPRCALSWRPRRRCSLHTDRCPRCTSSTMPDGSTAGPRSCWCRTTPIRWIGLPQAPVPRWTAADSESSFSTHRITAHILPGEPGAQRIWTFLPRLRCTLVLMGRQ
ncbi:diacylglycerol kinase [Rhodococcus ruber BKS 20-38]|uniref:Diacylglycerol kinase n=1 Tax=Rhodococcus ruber BKS 20-38 TaxID=1278076 RepID=M3A3L7_9NOCA|nr:acylglycerol kinase family protein [Rhodococcus ruber]EME67054.1 diacylglycerol kinase [Rhodococcus ruber BKS 20-38]